MSRPSNAGSLLGQRLDKYDVLALLALGGTAEIYLARAGGEAGFEKYLVIKCLHGHLANDADFIHMFRDEARLGATLDHSNIVQILELGESGGRYYMVMEYLAGMSLAMIARKARSYVPGGRIPGDIVLGLAAQACGGLHYAHTRTSPTGEDVNIVHRDISPQNIVVSYDGILKLVDFGIAKAEGRETQTKSGTIKGKFAYMSPEQCLAKPLDGRSDIFALGVIVHELLTGKRLFKRETAYATYSAILEGKVPRPSEVAPDIELPVDDVVMKALAYEAEHRYATAEEFGEAMLGVLHNRGQAVGPGDVARFFEQYYRAEIDAHGAHMRELVTGTQTRAAPQISWDNENESSENTPEESDADATRVADSFARIEPPDEDRGEATRIEVNPLAAAKQSHFELTGEYNVAADKPDAALADSLPAIGSEDGEEATRLHEPGASNTFEDGFAPQITEQGGYGPANRRLGAPSPMSIAPQHELPLRADSTPGSWPQPSGQSPQPYQAPPPQLPPKTGLRHSKASLAVALFLAFALGLTATWLVAQWL